MKTMTPNEAVRTVMKEKEVTPAQIFHQLETIEPGIQRQRIYDRVNSKNPTIAVLNSLLSHLGYSVMIVPNEKAAKMPNSCIKLVVDQK